MGYTHYWRFKKPGKGKAKEVEANYQKAIRAINKLAVAYNKARPSGSEDRLSGFSAFSLKYGGVKLNGSGENAHEDFCLREHFKQNFDNFGAGFHFCKTARKPYDVVVTAALCILEYYLGDSVSIGTDGRCKDWVYGVALAAQITKLKTLDIPKGIKEDELEHAQMR